MQGKYKKSIFNIAVDKLPSNEILIFNSYHSTFGIMDVETQVLYDGIEQYSLDDLNENNNWEVASVLSQNGFIVPAELNECDLVDLRSQQGKFDRSSLSLTIAPTLSCNMVCPYCFEQYRSGNMSDVVQEALCIFVEKRIENSNCKRLHITWYGGEPLLAVDIIDSLSQRIIAFCESSGVEYTASIITNGVLLTREVAEQLNVLMVKHAQITIDGTAEYHNKRRILKNGGDSFNTIISNIDACSDLLKISVRVNVDEGNIGNIDDLLSYLVDEKGWTKNPAVYLAQVENYTDAEYFDQTAGAEISRFLQHDAALLSRTCDLENNTTNQNLFPRRRVSFCHASIESAFVVDPDGYLYKCWNVIGDHQKAVGTLADHSKLNLEGLRWMSFKPGIECDACPFLPICMGGCPYQFLEKGRRYCNLIQENTIMRLKLAYQQHLMAKQK